jgi:hypothetical protein
LPVLPFSLACRCAMIRAVKWMDEVEEEKRQKVVHEGKRWTKSSTAPRKPAWWHRCRRVGPGKRQQQLLGCRSVSRQPTDCSKSCEYEVRPLYKMDGTVIEAELRGEARTFLEAYCREAPQTPSSVLQALLHERFALRVSVSQINRVRAALGGSLHPKSQEQGKKRE